jgi:hypothetical protein
VFYRISLLFTWMIARMTQLLDVPNFQTTATHWQ